MNTIDTIVNIEKSKLKDFQSAMDKYIFNINKFGSKIDNNNLVDILILNKQIEDVINQINENNINIFKKNKSNLSNKNRLELETYEKNNKILKKYLPLMLIDSLNSE